MATLVAPETLDVGHSRLGNAPTTAVSSSSVGDSLGALPEVGFLLEERLHIREALLDGIQRRIDLLEFTDALLADLTAVEDALRQLVQQLLQVRRGVFLVEIFHQIHPAHLEVDPLLVGAHQDGVEPILEAAPDNGRALASSSEDVIDLFQALLELELVFQSLVRL